MFFCSGCVHEFFSVQVFFHDIFSQNISPSPYLKSNGPPHLHQELYCLGAVHVFCTGVSRSRKNRNEKLVTFDSFLLQREIKDKENTLFSDRLLTFSNIMGANSREMGLGG